MEMGESNLLTYEKYNTENDESIVCFTQGAKMSRTDILTMINRNFGMWMTASSKNVQFIRIELFVRDQRTKADKKLRINSDRAVRRSLDFIAIHVNKGRTIIKVHIT